MIVPITSLLPHDAKIEKHDLGYLFFRYARGDVDQLDRAFREWADVIEDIYLEERDMRVKIIMREEPYV